MGLAPSEWYDEESRSMATIYLTNVRREDRSLMILVFFPTCQLRSGEGCCVPVLVLLVLLLLLVLVHLFASSFRA